MSKIKFDGEKKTSACRHLSEFNLACNNLEVSQYVKLCRLFTFTLEGQIQAWYKALPVRSIHSWKQFMEVFLDAHDNYDYDYLCPKLNKK